MEKRINIQQTEPGIYEALFALENYLKNTQLTPIQKELIKIRASQINGCAFCLNMHTKDALNFGETTKRIFLLNAWREAGVFTEEEQVMLAMTEELTLIHQQGLTEDTYQRAKALLNDQLIAQVIMAVIAINAWNRIAISTRMKPVG